MSIENILFHDITLGMKYQREHLVRSSDFALFVMLAGSYSCDGVVAAPAMGVFLFITSACINSFPGHGAILKEQALRAHGDVQQGDVLHAFVVGLAGAVGWALVPGIGRNGCVVF